MADHANGVNGHTKTPALVASAPDFLATDFDYVVVGGGTAGLVVAARLTENPDVKVGVLEAGPCKLDDPLVDTPAYFLQMLGNADYDYKFMTEPQQGNRGKVHHMPRGKMLGGSSGVRRSTSKCPIVTYSIPDQLHDVRPGLRCRLRRLGRPHR